MGAKANQETTVVEKKTTKLRGEKREHTSGHALDDQEMCESAERDRQQLWTNALGAVREFTPDNSAMDKPKGRTKRQISEKRARRGGGERKRCWIGGTDEFMRMPEEQTDARR